MTTRERPLQLGLVPTRALPDDLAPPSPTNCPPPPLLGLRAGGAPDGELPGRHPHRRADPARRRGRGRLRRLPDAGHLCGRRDRPARIPLAGGDWVPGTHLDLGGGTGAATWAVADACRRAPATPAPSWTGPSPPSPWAPPWPAPPPPGAYATPTGRAGRWAAPPAPRADLITVSYVLGELTATDREALLGAAAEAAAGAVVVVEPGTPRATRVIAARDGLIARRTAVLAPCPHDGPCR